MLRLESGEKITDNALVKVAVCVLPERNTDDAVKIYYSL